MVVFAKLSRTAFRRRLGGDFILLSFTRLSVFSLGFILLMFFWHVRRVRVFELILRQIRESRDAFAHVRSSFLG